MKRKILLYICIAAVILPVVSVVGNESDEVGKKGVVRVEDVCLTNESILIYPDSARIPLLELLTALGYPAKEQDSGTYILINNGETFLISLENRTLVQQEDQVNLLIPAPGTGQYFCQLLGEDLIVDSNTLRWALAFMGISINIDIRYEEAAVYIEKTVP